ncbi:hypothetical protein RGQ29_014493 [Quercus rubra]|uniref:Uncharacterized protein n=1 Tax=Quercus rubra TaxID=3512 RepID=A0AAN7J3G1_QUERU|nr:hypothetical protein RGQ29_014493 [Quercus rubra]
MEVGSILDNEGHIEIKKRSQKVTCPKVPPMLRRNERSKDYFDPRVISFGPYHHGKPEFQEAEMLKTNVMLEFIANSSTSFVEFYSKVCEINDYTRSCYVDGSTNKYSDDVFALMMLRDSCFILYVMENVVRNRWDKFYACRDMILLENQIPFSLLILLMRLRYGDEKLGLRMIKPFACFIIWAINPEDEFSKIGDLNEKPHHCFNFCKTKLTQLKELEYTDYVPSFRSVEELKAKGIHFKPTTSSFALLEKKGKSISLRDVRFKSGFINAELKLPPLILTPSKITLYNNLVALEFCPPSDKDLAIASYFFFLNTLIESVDDVKELRSKRILLNNLGSDEEVGKMLKEINSCGMQDLGIYQGVREDIEEHYNSKIKTWLAEIIGKYFSNPWTALGFFTAITVLALTILQAYYRINK